MWLAPPRQLVRSHAHVHAGSNVSHLRLRCHGAGCICRYALYQPYLEKLRKQGVAGGVVLTDARDVFIQSDPWQDPLVQQMVVEVGADVAIL